MLQLQQLLLALGLVRMRVMMLLWAAAVKQFLSLLVLVVMMVMLLLLLSLLQRGVLAEASGNSVLVVRAGRWHEACRLLRPVPRHRG